MVFGIQTDIFEDTKSRKIFHIKSTNKNYLLQDGLDFKVRLLRMNIVDSISFVFLFNLLFHLPMILNIVFVAVIYFAYLFYFNYKIMPNLQEAKKVERKQQIVSTKKETPFPIVAIGYLLIGMGLIYCLLTHQVTSEMMILVCGATIVSLSMGMYYLLRYAR